MQSRSTIRRQRIFALAVLACVQFVVLTVIAMFLYPGGTVIDPTTSSYSFFECFFSDLGRTECRAGQANTASAVLFVVALTLAGLGLVLFSVAMPHFFKRGAGRYLSWAGSAFGVVSGLAFVGIAFTPADLYLEIHGLFVQVAFLTFFVATLFYTAAILLTPIYPNAHAAVFGAFAILLAAYLWLLFFGPSLETEAGLVIQATGQKIIVYAAIISIGIEAEGARRLAARS
jgi:hypothetical protein